MRTGILFVLFAVLSSAIPVHAEDLAILTRPDTLYVERMEGNIVPMERVFFHIVLHNASMKPLTVDWVRFDLTNSQGAILSGQYSGPSLLKLFDDAIDRKRI